MSDNPFAQVTPDPYWQAKLDALRKLAGLEAYTAQQLVTMARCQIAEMGLLRGLEIYMLGIAAGS